MEAVADRRALRADLVQFTGDPGRLGESAVRVIEDGVVLVADGRIVALGPARDLLNDLPAGVEVSDCRDCLAMAGFVDAHVHYTQTGVIASRAANLLEWLHTHTFPEEMRFADESVAREGAAFFLDGMLSAGTTSAAVFCATAAVSCEVLFEAACARNLRLIAGKVMMDRNAPAGLLDDAESSERDTDALIRRWHDKGRLGYAITPRFAITSTEAQLAAAGRLAAAHPTCHVHSHISESEEELREVAELFPEDTDYTAVYARHGLLRRPAIFAHGIHLSEDELRRFHATGASLVHCPTANTFLGSGLMDLAAVRRADRPVRLGLGTDVGGGTSLSMLPTMAEAYKVAQLRGQTLHPFELFYLATRGGAEALGQEAHIGTLAPGMEADLVVLDPAATGMLAHRAKGARDAADRLFALMMLGDERAVRETWVAGLPCYRAQPA